MNFEQAREPSQLTTRSFSFFFFHPTPKEKEKKSGASSSLCFLLASFLVLFTNSGSASGGDCKPGENTGIELHYWNGRGLMEVARVMLSLAGHFPSDGYKDQRWVRGTSSMVPADDPSSSSSSFVWGGG